MDYEMKTTFWTDFTIADLFGINAIKDTAKRAFKGWKNDIEYMTELVMVLNWKIWEHYEHGNHDVAKVYDELWKKYDNWVLNNFEGDDIKYFLDVTD